MRRRLLTSYLALTIIVLVVLEVPLAVTYGDRVRQQEETRLQRDAFMVANYAEETLEHDAHAPIQSYAESYARRTDSEVVIVDGQGRVVADSSPLTSASSTIGRRPDIAAALRGATTSGSHSGGGFDDPVMFSAVPVTTSGRVIGAVGVTYGADKVADRIHAYWLLLAGAALVCLAAAALVGILFSRWVTQPLVPLRRAAIRIGRGDLDARVGPGAGPPEVREVAAAFDEMASRLEGLVGAQEAFVADASHQLRTPLTALRLRLENLETEIDGEEARDDVAGARQETERLARLVDGLVTLARADRGSDGSDRSLVDLDAATAERIEMWRPVADERRVELVADPSDLRVQVSPDRLALVLDNLLANATDASPRDGNVRMSARPSADRGWVELHVIDQGPGLDAEQRRRAFDRFWRADARSQEADGASLGGSGLGLAIVRRLVSVDGGRVELREADGGGVDAVVSYPAAEG